MKKVISSLFFSSAVLMTPPALLAAPNVYIPLGTANEVLIVDAATDKAVGRIGEVINPHGLAITPNGKVLVAGSNQETEAGQRGVPPKPADMSEEAHRRHHNLPAAGEVKPGVGMSHVAVIDAQDRRVIRRVDVQGAAHHNLVTPDGRYAVSTHTTTGGISVIDLMSYKVVKTVATGPLPNYMAVTRDGKRIYVSNTGNNTISEIDTEHWIVTRNIPVGRAPGHIVLSVDETALYSNNVAAGTVSVVSLKQGKVTRTYTVGKSPHGIDLADDGKTLYVASKQDNKLVAINLADGKQRYIALSPAPYHVTAIRGMGKLYISSRKAPKIWVVDQSTLKILGEIPLRGTGHQMAVARNQ